MAKSVLPFLMFEGRAEEAMNFYVSLFADGRIEEIKRYGAGQAGKEGSVQLARFSIAGQSVMCIDSPAKHAFTFTPSVSLFTTCEDEAEFERLTTALVEGGTWLMPPDNYGFSRRFGWCNDRFGVSWQINLP